MTASPLFPRFDGLMHLSRREGVDVRPTLLRVLTDLYVQAPSHSDEERQHYAELATRLIDEVDDATRAVITARLSAYPDTPEAVAAKLGLNAAPEPTKDETAMADDTTLDAQDRARPALPQPRRTIGMQPSDASAIDEMFFVATSAERVQILHNLAQSPLAPAARGEPKHREAAIVELERLAFAADAAAFTTTLADALRLPDHLAARIVNDAGGEALACALKALGMRIEIYERVLLFLNPEIGASVMTVFRLSRLYASLGDRAPLIMLAVWRGATVARVRAKYQPQLHDDERRSARSFATPTPMATPGSAATEPETPKVATVTPLRG